MIESFEVVGVVAAHFHNAHKITFPAHGVVEVGFAGVYPLVDVGRR